MAEGPLDVHDGVVVVGTVHHLAMLGHLVVVGMEGVDVLGIGEREFAGEVLVARDEGDQGVAAVVGRKHHVDDSLRQGFDVADDAGTALVQYEDDGLSGGREFAHEFLLVRGEVQVVHVAGGLAVGILAHAGDDDIGPAGSSDGFRDASGVLTLPVTAFINDTGLIGDLVKTVPEGFQDGIVLRGESIALALPGVGPAAVQGAEGVGVRAGHEDAFGALQGQDALVLEEYLGLDGSVIGLLCKGLGGKLGIFVFPDRIVEQTQTDLQAEHAAHGVIDTLHRDTAVLDQSDDDVAALGIVRVHDHVDAGVDAHGHSLGLVSRHMVAGEEVVDVGPVGHEHAVPVQLLLHPAGEEGLVRMRGDAVDGSGIDHRGEGAGLEALLERTEILLAQVVLRDVGGGAVLAGVRHAIAHEMLDAHGRMFQVDMVGILSLDGHGLGAGHLGLQVRVLTPTFPLTRPARVTPEVHHRREHPRALRGACLIGHRMAHHPGKIAVEGGPEVDFLRVEGAVCEV